MTPAFLQHPCFWLCWCPFRRKKKHRELRRQCFGVLERWGTRKRGSEGADFRHLRPSSCSSLLCCPSSGIGAGTHRDWRYSLVLPKFLKPLRTSSSIQTQSVSFRTPAFSASWRYWPSHTKPSCPHLTMGMVTLSLAGHSSPQLQS